MIVAPRREFNIEVMIRDPLWLGDTQISLAQMGILKAAYGLALGKEEMEVYLALTEGRPPRPGGYTEITLVCGVRSGKTDKIVANAALYEALVFDERIMAPGEKGYVPIIAQNIEGARTAWGYVEGKARLLEEKGRRLIVGQKPILDPGAGQMKSITGKEIRFSNRVVVACFPCNKAGVRGKTCIAAIGDEFAFWDTSDSAYDSDVEIFRALRSRMATMRGRGKLFKITSPFGTQGEAFTDWQERAKSKRMFIQVPSWVLNPNLSKAYLDEQRDLDPEGFNREFGAQFGLKGGTYLVPHRVDEAMSEERPQTLPFVRGRDYVAWIDVAFKHDLYVLGIAHLDSERGVVFDLITWEKGSKKSPLDPKAVARRMTEEMRRYGLDVVRGDQYAAVPVASDYAPLGVKFIEVPKNANSSWAMFQGLKASLRHGRVHLPHDDIIRRDLMSLVLMKAGQNSVPRVAAPERSGMHDDISNVVASLVQYFEPIRLTSLDIEEWNKRADMGGTDLTTFAGRRKAAEIEERRRQGTGGDVLDDIVIPDDIMGMEF